MFLPTTIEEVKKIGWDCLDVVIVSGDTYIDSPYIGAALIGKVLLNAGYKVGIIAQPDVKSVEDIGRLGEPSLFWGVTGGSVDSMVANYTANNKWRKSDDFTPGGENNKRPNRAVIKYSNLIRRFFKNTKPIVLGGIEASLRRIAHYDFWSNTIRKSILFNSKADYLVYGMGEKTILQLAACLKEKVAPKSVKGICYISKELPKDALTLPDYSKVVSDKYKFIEMFDLFYKNNDPLSAKKLIQKQDSRYLVQNPPNYYLSEKEMDEIYKIKFERDVHPFYKKDGKVKALDTIKFSISSHRGCYGECNFCAIAVHQGRTVRWRSENSILNEVEEFRKDKRFRGVISDVGGPTANMYGFECEKKLKEGVCNNKRCLFPKVCNSLKPNHSKQMKLLEKIKNIDKVKKVFIASGIRYDLINDDRCNGNNYLKKIVTHHTSGQMKIAPEHMDVNILNLMGKPSNDKLIEFKKKFENISTQNKKKQFLTYYLIAAHPGCSIESMKKLNQFIGNNFRIKPEQVQIFTPTPSTYSTLMYYTEINPFTKKRIFVEKNKKQKQLQKEIITKKTNTNKVNKSL